MPEYTATIHWQHHESESYIENKYSRGHQWLLDGGMIYTGTPSGAGPLAVIEVENEQIGTFSWTIIK